MPEKEIAARGGAKRWRTIKVGDKYVRIAIVKKAGPRGGHTVAGPVRTKKKPIGGSVEDFRAAQKKGK